MQPLWLSSQVCISMVAKGFLRKMARIIAGTLVEVGCGCRDAGTIPQILATGDRALAGPALPASGLCLQHVEYERPWKGRRADGFEA